MLKVGSRAARRYKCPKHPRQQYDYEGALPASCDACHTIAAVLKAVRALDAAGQRAGRWQSIAGVGSGFPGGTNAKLRTGF